MPGFDNNVVYANNLDFSGGNPVVGKVVADGQLLIGSTVAPNIRVATLTAGTGIGIANGNGSITISNTGATSFASVAETKLGLLTNKALNPADLSGYMADFSFTGLGGWYDVGNFFDDTTLGTFQLLRGGHGYILGKQITWVPQSISGMTAGNTYYIYIDDTGTIGKTTVFSGTLFSHNIVLFECMRDSTPVTNNQVTVREDHFCSFQTTVSVYLHQAIGAIIQNSANGANITLQGTQKIQIVGEDNLLDHGLTTIIPDSGGGPVTFYKYYTTGAGKWARYSATDTFTGHYNAAGTPTALSAGRFAVYTLYCSKANLNTDTPFYYAVLNTSQYTSLSSANSAISNGSIAQSSNELSALEVCQLGYIVFGQSANAIVQVTISKSTLKQTLSTNGSNTAALIQTNVTNFNGWLDSTDTNVQAALDELDDSRRAIEVTGASQACAINRSYVANRATLVTFTLPTVAKIGDEIEITGQGIGGWLIAQNANQYINNVSVTSTIGVGGSFASSQRFDHIRLKCTTANLGFTVCGGTGNWTIV